MGRIREKKKRSMIYQEVQKDCWEQNWPENVGSVDAVAVG